MESTQIVGKRSMKLRFIILQLVTVLLVIVVLLSFSNAPLALFGTDKTPAQNVNTESKPAANSEAVTALENNLITYQNLVKEKEQKIKELQASMKTMQAGSVQPT